MSDVIDTTDQRRQLISTIGGDPHLLGSACSDCATQTFPAQSGCPRCGSNSVSEVALPREGSVWTWTVQRFAPKAPYQSPSPYQPYALAYVDLGPVKVESRLRGKPIDGWQIGDAVQIVIDDAASPLTFWFEPRQETT
ncbi:MAG: OB-fold domain-containing protein [Actinomycetota bacterium]|nr:OB-fold domain-containing protein [Actinomycetota bacterium]